MERFVSDVGSVSRDLCGVGSQVASGTMARRLLSIVERRCGPAVWDACSMKVLAAVLPDATGKARPIEDGVARDVRQRFGVSLLMVSAVACFWGQVPRHLQNAALSASYVAILRAAERAGHQHVQPNEWVHLLD